LVEFKNVSFAGKNGCFTKYVIDSIDRSEPLAYRRADAASLVGVSLDSFERYVQPELRIIRRGSIRLVPRSELVKWIERNAERALEDIA